MNKITDEIINNAIKDVPHNITLGKATVLDSLIQPKPNQNKKINIVKGISANKWKKLMVIIYK